MVSAPPPRLGTWPRIVVGNSHTLKADEHWEKWLQFYEKVASGVKGGKCEWTLSFWLFFSLCLKVVWLFLVVFGCFLVFCLSLVLF